MPSALCTPHKTVIPTDPGPCALHTRPVTTIGPASGHLINHHLTLLKVCISPRIDIVARNMSYFQPCICMTWIFSGSTTRSLLRVQANDKTKFSQDLLFFQWFVMSCNLSLAIHEPQVTPPWPLTLLSSHSVSYGHSMDARRFKIHTGTQTEAVKFDLRRTDLIFLPDEC